MTDFLGISHESSNECDFVEAYQSDDDQQHNDTVDIDCRHLQVSIVEGSNVCNDCGMKIDESLVDNETRYFGACDSKFNKDPTRHHQRKDEERSLYYDLQPLNIPQKVIEIANEYYKQIIQNNIYRSKNRKSIVFACTYYAYIDINEPKPPEELSKLFNLNKKRQSRGILTFSKFIRDRKKKVIVPTDLVEKILSDVGVENKAKVYEYIKYMYEHLTDKKMFKCSNPYSVASGLVYYYIKDILNMSITKNEYAKIVKLTSVTFETISDEIRTILDKQHQ